jgi:methanogenic corrinoid protein MtbC1
MSIGDLARAVGIPAGTLRAWERRYGVPAAERLPSGHRRYRAEQVVRLRVVAEAVAAGIRPSVALAQSAEELRSRVDAAAGAVPASPRAGSLERLLAGLRDYDAGEVRRRFRAAADRASSAHALCDDVVGPFLRAVGRAWADGRIDVRHEHFLSEVVEAELHRRLASVRVPRAARAAVLATLPGERHAIGIAMAAVVAAEAGFRPVLLGADTPVDQIARAAAESRAAAVVLSVSLASDPVDADAFLRSLRELLPAACRILAGGAGLRRRGRRRRGLEVLGRFGELDAVLREPRAASQRKAATRRSGRGTDGSGAP